MAELTNLLINPSFLDYTTPDGTSWDGMQGWVENSSGSDLAVDNVGTIVDVDGHRGIQWFRFGGNGEGVLFPGFQSWRFPVTPGSPISFRVGLRVDYWAIGNNGAFAFLRYYNAAGYAIGDSPTDSIVDNYPASTTTGVRMVLEREHIVPAGADSACLIIFQTSTANTDTIMTMDRPAVVEAPLAVWQYFDGDSFGAHWEAARGYSPSVRDDGWSNSQMTQRMLDLLRHRRVAPGSENDRLLEAIVGAVGFAADRLGRVAFGDANTGAPGGRVLRDPRVAPLWALAHAAMYVGAELPGRNAGESLEDWTARARDLTVYPLGIKRGTHEAIRRAVKPHLTGTKTVIIIDNAGGNPYALLVRTITSETPDPALVESVLEGDYVSGGRRGAIRAELSLTYVVSDEPTFAEATEHFNTVAPTVRWNNVTTGDVT